MNNVNAYTQKSSIPKIFYDIAFLTFVVPTVLYTLGYTYKLGRFKFYGVPADYIEVGYNDILAVWLLPLIFLFVLLLPLYPFLIPTHILEELSSAKEKIEQKEKRSESKWKQWLTTIIVILMSFVSLVILISLSDYWYLFKLIPFFIALLFFSTILFWLQSRWKTRNSYRHKLFKLASFLFSTILLIVATGGISESLGVFEAERKTKYQMVCYPERNWMRVAKSGDRIIAKEVSIDTKKITGRTVLIGGNCEDFVMLEDITFAGELTQ